MMPINYDTEYPRLQRRIQAMQIKLEIAENRSIEDNKALSIAILAKQSAENQASAAHQKTYAAGLESISETHQKLKAAEAMLKAMISKEISLPKITPEIYDEHKCFIDGDMDWTQEAVDFACLIASDVYDRLEQAEHCVKSEQL